MNIAYINNLSNTELSKLVQTNFGSYPLITTLSDRMIDRDEYEQDIDELQKDLAQAEFELSEAMERISRYEDIEYFIKEWFESIHGQGTANFTEDMLDELQDELTELRLLKGA